MPPKKARLSNKPLFDNNQISKQLVRPKTLKEIVSIVLGLIVFGLILIYIFDLETQLCHCSAGFKRDYIKYYTIFLVLLRIALLVKPSLNLLIFKHPLIILLLVCLNVMFYVTIVLYIKELREIECECSENWKRSIIEIYAYVIVFIIAILTAILILLLFFKSLLN